MPDEPLTEIGRAAVDVLVKAMNSRAGLVSAQCIAAKVSVREEVERIFDAAKAQYLAEMN